MLYTLRFFLSSKCSLFHNANLFGSCIIHILYTGCVKIKKNNSGANSLRVYEIELQVMKAAGSLINIVNCILRQADDIQTVVLSGCKSCSVCMSRRHWNNYKRLDMVQYSEWQG